MVTQTSSPVDSILADIKLERSKLETVEEEPIWREEPANLQQFVESEAYCDLPPLTDLQYKAAIEILGIDPKKIFDVDDNTGVNVAVLLWGKGSGKDYLTSILQLYCVHVVLCLTEPQLYFDQAPGEPLDIVNVAYSANQAKNVYFTKFLARLKRCRWFRRRFDLQQSGRLLEKRKAESWGLVRISTTIVTFPGNIRAISESSENESYEGYNILVWIMDEASAFKSAKKVENAINIFNTLKSSANTRFIGRWLGFVLSYPRKEDDWDFTTQLYIESLTSDSMYGSRKFSWEVIPFRYAGPTFTFIYDRPNQHIELEVPESLREDFEKHPEESLGKYCCMPGRSQGAFIELAGAIPRVISDRLPIFTTETIIVENRNEDGSLLFRGIGHRIVQWDMLNLNKQLNYVIHIDLSKTDDRAAIVVAHGEPVLLETQTKEGKLERTWSQRIVEDAHVVYEPDRKKNLRVSIRNIESLILDIAQVISISMVTYDHWQSASSVETLAMAGVAAKEHNINREDYNLLRSVIYSGDIDLLPDPLTEYELTQLRKTGSGNVDHPEGGSKDLADALAGVTRLLLKNDSSLKKQLQAKNTGMPRATTSYGHTEPDSQFNVGPIGSAGITSARASHYNNSSFGYPNLDIPDVPTMPFGIGTSGRPRPQIRALSGGVHKMSSASGGLTDSLISGRIRELR